MKEEYWIFILMSSIGLLCGAILLYNTRKEKHRKIFMYGLTASFLLMPALMIPGMILDCNKLLIMGLIFPSGFIMFIVLVLILIAYQKCTYELTAECTGFNIIHSRYRRYRQPKFRYTYNGQEFENLSFLSYSKRKFKKMFKENEKYTIYINPDIPQNCVDKRTFPYDTFLLIIIAIPLFVLGVFVGIYA